MRKLSDYPDAHLRIFERPPVPEPEHIREIYLIGICGTGMGMLAGLLKEAGYTVRGSDRAAYPPMSTFLEAMGIPVYEGFDAAHLSPAPDLVVVGNACTPTHPEAAYAREHRMPQLSLPEALKYFFLHDRRPLVVAGTHGKTTTSGLLAHLFTRAGESPGYFIGGVYQEGTPGFAKGSGPVFVIEGDEYDSAYFDKSPKFWHYQPHSAIVTSVEFDHADIYEDAEDYQQAFRQFVDRVSPEGLLLLYGDDARVRELAQHTNARVRFYGFEHPAVSVTAREVEHTDTGQHFTLVIDDEPVGRFLLPLSGKHNLLNALAALALGVEEGLSIEALQEGLATFKGMKRRQEVKGEINGVLVVDDFAHHPTAVRETIKAIRRRWPDRRLLAVFEPRSNTSRRKIFEQAYSEAFDEAHQVFLSVPPLRHNDNPEDFIDAYALSQRILAREVQAQAFASADELLPALLQAIRPGDVVLIMSNGNFDDLHEHLLEQLKALPRSTAPMPPS